MEVRGLRPLLRRLDWDGRRARHGQPASPPCSLQFAATTRQVTTMSRSERQDQRLLVRVRVSDPKARQKVTLDHFPHISATGMCTSAVSRSMLGRACRSIIDRHALRVQACTRRSSASCSTRRRLRTPSASAVRKMAGKDASGLDGSSAASVALCSRSSRASPPPPASPTPPS